MDRKKLAKIIKSPETMHLPPKNETLFFETPKKIQNERRYSVDDEKDDFFEKNFFEFKKDSFFERITSFFRHHLATFITYFLFFTIFMIFFCKMKNNCNVLEGEITKLRKIIRNRDLTKDTLNNYVSHESGCKIDYANTSKCYKYGLFNRKYSNDPSVILGPSLLKGHCFAFPSNSGSVSFEFDLPIFVSQIGILHPFTENRKSAIKKFTIIGINEDIEEVGSFLYCLDGDFLQRYDINKGPYKRIKINIENNHGNKKYTCIYKIYIYGNEV